MSVDETDFYKIVNEALNVLNLVGKKYDIKVLVYSACPKESSFKIQLLSCEENSSVYSEGHNTFHSVYGLDKEFLGSQFSFDGKKYKFIGLDVKNKRRPYVVQEQKSKLIYHWEKRKFFREVFGSASV